MAVSTGITYSSPIPRMEGGNFIEIIHAFIKVEWHDSRGTRKTPYTRVSHNSLYQAHKITTALVD